MNLFVNYGIKSRGCQSFEIRNHESSIGKTKGKQRPASMTFPMSMMWVMHSQQREGFEKDETRRDALSRFEERCQLSVRVFGRTSSGVTSL